MRTPTARWLAGAVAGAGYGVFLSVTAMRLPAGAELTGQFGLQPAVKALMALLLAAAALGALVCAALLARLPTPCTALGAVCFAVSDAMIGIGRSSSAER